ncbi:hypothetical protein JCM10207_000467 [Rhodosporidiobolus poonsookiae]
MDRPTPRVNAARLAQTATGKTVRLIGEVVTTDSSQVVLKASDGGQVKVNHNSMNTFSDTFVEVIGKVVDTDTISELSSIMLGSSVDMNAVEKMVELTHQYPDVFPSE